MSLSLRAAAFGVALLATVAGAQAATVAAGGTGTTGAGGVTFLGGGATTDWDASRPGVWTTATTTPASDWVQLDGLASTYVFNFDMTGFDLSTAALTVLWSVDNTGTAFLNGVDISGLYTDFTALQTVSVTGAPPFNAGANVLSFETTGDGRTDGFRASILVEADLTSTPPAVPLPATLPLLLGAVAAVGARRRMKRKA